MASEFPIKSEAIGLRAVLSERYRIPVYQRPYEWEEKNIDDFLTSIFEGFREKTKGKQVFFGTIQLNHENKNDTVKDIVDGQQRLTTFLLFLSILQKLCDGTKETDFDCNGVIESDELKKVLNSNQEDESILDDDSRYSKNKKLLYKKVTSYRQNFDQISDFYSELLEYILNNVYLVKLDTEEMELSDVVSVFNTINTTGLDLNATDVFKFRYYDFLKRRDNTTPWMEKINECYKTIDDSNEKRVADGKTEQSVLNMSWVLDIYKHIICAQFGWRFSEVSKSNQKFFDDLFKGKKYVDQEDTRVLEFESFKVIVEGFVKYYRWIEDAKYNDKNHEIVKELFSGDLIGKSRYSRYWTIPFIVAYFKAKGSEWNEKIFIDSLRVNLYMFKFFMIYSVVNDKVINAVQDRVCRECFKWFKECSINEIIANIKGMMWPEIRGERDELEKKFYGIIKSGLFYNGSRAHLVCTLVALLDEVENLGKTFSCATGEITVTEGSIQERLFNWKDNPYDIEHIFARYLFKDDQENAGVLNGIGNLVVLDQSINRKLKDKPVNKKVTEYKKSKYVSVRFDFLERYEECQEWGIKEIEDRKEREIKKIEAFMTT